jgi:hypothetical protein
VQLNPAQRAGILTQAAFLASQADPGRDNPVHRGLAVYENVLCGAVDPPPAVMPPIPPTAAAGTTTRDLFQANADLGPTCASCHAIFNPPGFAFENYDAVGAYRTTDNGSPVDSMGSFLTPGGCKSGDPCGTNITFHNAVDLSTQLAALPEARWCAERQWYRYAAARLETVAESGSSGRVPSRCGHAGLLPQGLADCAPYVHRVLVSYTLAGRDTAVTSRSWKGARPGASRG